MIIGICAGILGAIVLIAIIIYILKRNVSAFGNTVGDAFKNADATIFRSTFIDRDLEKEMKDFLDTPEGLKKGEYLVNAMFSGIIGLSQYRIMNTVENRDINMPVMLRLLLAECGKIPAADVSAPCLFPVGTAPEGTPVSFTGSQRDKIMGWYAEKISGKSGVALDIYYHRNPAGYVWSYMKQPDDIKM